MYLAVDANGGDEIDALAIRRPEAHAAVVVPVRKELAGFAAPGRSQEDLAGPMLLPAIGSHVGEPLALADLEPGEHVIDLGSGAGFDAFLAAKSVGPGGKVVGIDMTPGMIDKAQRNAEQLDVKNVEFRLGEIEHLPAEDDSADVVLSNCVINLSPNKNAVYGEIFRILKPGGRISISDVLRSRDIPKDLKDDLSAYTG